MPLPAMHPTTLPLFHLLQTRLLFRSEILRNLTVCFDNGIAHPFSSVAADSFQLRTGLFDDRGDLVHLFVGQPKLPLQTVLHRPSGKTVTMRTEKEMMRRGRADENAGGASGHKDEHETGDQFPLQRAIHCPTSS